MTIAAKEIYPQKTPMAQKYALMLAKRGCKIIRLRGKVALDRAWQNGATDDPEIIKQWFADKPDLNYGVVAGENLFVLDIDTKNADGFKAAAEILGIEVKDLPSPTFSVKTPSGGLHLYFKSEKAYGNSASTIAKGLDSRSGNGYVVGPGSALMLPGEFGEGFDRIEYKLQCLNPFAPLPDALKAKLSEAIERSKNAQESLSPETIDSEGAIIGARTMLKKRASAIEGQGGDEHTLVTAELVRDFNVSEAMCLELMLGHWNDRCDPPWPLDELETKVSNAYRYAKRPMGTKGGTLFDNPKFADLFPVSKLPPGFHDNDNAKGDETLQQRFPLTTISKERRSTLDYVIENFIPLGMRGLFYGGEQSLKTTVAVKIGVDIAIPSVTHHGDRKKAGIEYPIKKHGAVVYVAAENPTGVRNMAREVMLDRDPKGNTEDVPFYVMDAPFRITKEDDVQELIGAIGAKLEASGDTLRLVVFDTAVFVLGGDDSEDKAETVTAAYAGANSIINAFDRTCSVIFLHHTGKDASKGARGSSNWVMSSEFRYRFTPKGEQEAKDGTRTIKFPASAVVTNEKTKDGPVQQPISYATRRVLFDVEQVEEGGKVTKVKSSALLADVVQFQEAKIVAGAYSFTDIVMLVVDHSEQGRRMSPGDLAAEADRLQLLSTGSEPDKRIEAFRKKIVRLLKDSTQEECSPDVKAFRDRLGNHLKVGTFTGGKYKSDGSQAPAFSYTFTGSGGKLGLWKAHLNRETARKATAEKSLMDLAGISEEEDFG